MSRNGSSRNLAVAKGDRRAEPPFRGRAPFIWSRREERIPQWILTSVFAIAAEALMDHADEPW